MNYAPRPLTYICVIVKILNILVIYAILMKFIIEFYKIEYIMKLAGLTDDVLSEA